MKALKTMSSRILAVMLALFLCLGTTTTAFAATFGELQDAIDGNGGMEFTTEDGSTRYGYGDLDGETGKYGVEAWDSDEGRNVQLNEDVQREEGETGITITGSKDVTLDLNGNDINAETEEGKTLDGSVISVGSKDKDVSGQGGNSLTLNDSKAEVTEDGDYVSGVISGGKTGVDIFAATEKDGANEFAMNGGTISGNTEDSLGGGVVNRSEFTMNGGEISGNEADKGGGVYVTGSGSMTMNGGAVSGNEASNGNGGGVYVANGGSFEMNNGSIGGNTATGNGGGVYVEGSKSEITMDGGAISGNEAANGGGVYTKGEFTMDGGEISNNTATTGNGGGVYADNTTVNVNGGEISGNKTNVDFEESEYAGTKTPTQGGGVYVTGKNGELNLAGGAISGNTAGEGGGAFINHGSKLEMTGGEVSGNTAKFGEGGGLYVWGSGEISGGKITGNTTETQRDLGGGGIYIESDGKLHLVNAIIKENTAGGLGGGLAACVHGKTIVYVNDGAIIYQNSAAGKNNTGDGHATTKHPNGNGSFIDGHKLWENDEAFKAGAQDIFTASDKGEKNDSGVPGVIVGNETLFGTANWTGFLFLYNEDGSLMMENGKPIWTEVTMDDEGGFVYGNRLLGLKANPDADTIAAAEAAAKEAAAKHVIISGNHSNTHGGGIGNNGTLTIGNKSPFEDDDTPDKVEGEKKFEKVEGAPENSADRDLKDGEFTFVLTDAEGNTYTGTNDKDGNIVIQLPKDYFTKAFEGKGEDVKDLTFTFTVKEKKTDDETVTFDESEYEVTVTVKREIVTDEIEIGDVKEFKTEKFTASVSYTKNGEAVDGIVFTNKYTPVIPGGENQIEIPRNNTPEEDPEDPSDPPEEDVELPEEDIPLAEMPDEEVELDDPDIPLSDVPQTGDISLAWYAAAGMSALGLAVLSLTKKREGEEG